MRKVTVSALKDDIAMQLLDENHKTAIPVETKDCLFHKWTTKLHEHPGNDEYMQEQDYGLVEFPDGTLHYVRPEQIQFQGE